ILVDGERGSVIPRLLEPCARTMDERGPTLNRVPVSARGPAVLLTKVIEDMWEKRRLDASAPVVHTHGRHRARGAHKYVDAPAFVAEFDGIRQEIPDNLLQSIAITEDGNRTLCGHYFEVDAPHL